jgi:type VI secretion system secreted protein Hcp
MASYAPGTRIHADFFLKIDGLEGESTDSKHKNEIELQSFSWGATQPGSAGHGGGAGVGKVQVHDFSFTKFFDKSSPKLFEACADGQHLPKVVLTCRKAGGEQQEYLKVTMSEVIISSLHEAGSEGNNLPMEQATLNFSKIEIEYKPQDEKGNLGGVIKGGWDLAQNKKV